MKTPEQATEQFEAYRPLLLGLAYRLLGSMWDAEDVVQDAYLRWTGTDRADIREPRAFLITIVSRLALDQLRSARVTREAYTGPWLPEPVATAALGPLDTAELRDTVAYATIHLMERLSPPERAVFVLREAFDLPYDEIARILDTTSSNCRQMHSRAGRRVTSGRDKFALAEDDHAKLLARFLEAAQSGDLTGLTELLTEDVVAWNDGGGKVRAALRPIEGRARVVAFIAGLVTRYPFGDARVVTANGLPALALTVDGIEQVVTISVHEGRIDGVYAVLNPDKLGHMEL
ncbi:RNA polymerase sigma-70 factor [Streptomyces sp. NBC_00203]|uniref:RNA polymerase sigma-70 factor n=1 Tax=Streptomyces sp. NBC_00203 TaxID=2975680 RepID=UPI0032524E8E